MKVLVIGSGGREHVLCWKISQSPKVKELFCLPGNGGIKKIAECIDISSENINEITKFCKNENIDLVVVGPEAPLVKGISDRLKKENIKVFGPEKKGAILEGSKIYSKNFMKKYDIPTAKYNLYDDAEMAKEELNKFNTPFVIKADGLAAGKGVLICNSYEEGKEAIKTIMEEKKFGDSGERIVIEEFLKGTEASLLCLVSNNKIIPLESARDYKMALDNDEGLNTGGMGCFSPNPLFTDNIKKHINNEIITKIEKGLKKENINFTGILFIGLMINNSKAKVLEFNVRFGDPEAQVVIPRLKNDLIEIINKTIEGTIEAEELQWSNKKSVAVVLASGGYPGKYEKNKEISGLNSLDEEITVFHSGTKVKKGKILTNGGRVLAVTALAESLEKAREKVYNSIEHIEFEGKQYRKDIAKL